MRDFTLRRLEELYNSILGNGYKIITYSEYVMQTGTRGKYLILRHDVDANPVKALKVAEIEKKLGIKGSYYIRNKQKAFNKDIIGKIASLGHEIGYHYEDLAKHRGNEKKAIISFENFLEKLRDIYPVKTMCMHGSPLSRHNNLNLWKSYDYRQFGIIADISLDTPFKRHWYLTDTGRGWNSRFTVRDKFPSAYNIPVADTQQLISLFNSRTLPPRIMINIHPQRWSDGYAGWTYELIAQSMKNLFKFLYIANLKISETE